MAYSFISYFYMLESCGLLLVHERDCTIHKNFCSGFVRLGIWVEVRSGVRTEQRDLGRLGDRELTEAVDLGLGARHEDVGNRNRLARLGIRVGM